LKSYTGPMSGTQLTRLCDFISGAGAMALVLAAASLSWRLVAIGMLLMAIGIGLYAVEFRRARSGKSN